MISSTEIRKSFISYWKEYPRNSKEIPNYSLVPQNDSTLLFVNSGMFPIVNYLSGTPHPLGKRLHNIQRCIRTNDIEEVGDNRHLVLFEMIGNWSLGDFGKKDQIPWIMDFYVQKCGLDPRRIYVSIFSGDKTKSRDIEAIDIWKETYKKYGIEAEFSENINNIPETLKEGENWKYRIFPYGKNKNWWSRAEVVGEIGGPTSEIFYDMGKIEKEEKEYHINDDSGRFIEIGNNVFMEYKLNQNLDWIQLEQKNIDFGGGFERLVMACQNTSDPFETDLFKETIHTIEDISKKSYSVEKETSPQNLKSIRVLAEHIRSSVFLIADGVFPSNKDQGYILRRLIRRSIRHAHLIGIKQKFTKILGECVIENYSHTYSHLKQKANEILNILETEEEKFQKTIVSGIKALYEFKDKNKEITGQKVFDIYQTFGFPFEMIVEELRTTHNLSNEQIQNLKIDFEKSFQDHQSKSRASLEKKFKGGLADSSKETTKLHTVHHLLLSALQKVISPNIKQKGSNITSERLRIDFNFDRKLTSEELSKVEELVNQKINDGLNVVKVEMPKEEAEKIGAEKEFEQKYPEVVTVYFITEENIQDGVIPKTWFSAEFCGGPHVKNTKELAEGNKVFKITNQESIGQGTKRIKGKLV